MLELLREGTELAIFGMGTVFILLGCLVIAVRGMSGLAARLEPALGPAAPPGSLPAEAAIPAGAGVGDDAELTVAVAAAVHAYRRSTRGNQ